MHKYLYGTKYWIDVWGNVFGENGQLRPTINSHGFPSYTIKLNDGKQKNFTAHIEVWRAWQGPIPKGGIKHKDGDKLNPAMDNLVPAHMVRRYIDYIKSGISITKIALHFGLPKKEISKWVSSEHPGGIRDLRKKYPLNKSIDIRDERGI